MKCRYKYCKNGSEVEKDDAIKENKAYYCKDCYKERNIKREIEQYYIENLPQAALKALRKVIADLIHKRGYDAEYILYMVKKIHTNNLIINSPFGLIHYCLYVKNFNEWKQIQVNKEYQKIKTKEVAVKNDSVDFKYSIGKNKWTDLI